MIFIKGHGLGNDYLVAHQHSQPLQPHQVLAICHRHTGLGGDGILEPIADASGVYGLRIWNPDGSLAEKSGNGLRIFARYLVDHRGAKCNLSIRVDAGVVRCQVDADAVTVEMGRATFAPGQIPATQALQNTAITVDQDVLNLTAVGVGNPHCVAFFPPETNLDGLPWRRWGEHLERHPLFPNRTNVQFARRADDQKIELRIWERGAGETSASGSSACAVAAAAVRLGIVQPGAITLCMPGGTLHVTVHPDFHLTLRGPVEEVGVLQLSENWWQRHCG